MGEDKIKGNLIPRMQLWCTVIMGKTALRCLEFTPTIKLHKSLKETISQRDAINGNHTHSSIPLSQTLLEKFILLHFEWDVYILINKLESTTGAA